MVDQLFSSTLYYIITVVTLVLDELCHKGKFWFFINDIKEIYLCCLSLTVLSPFFPTISVFSNI